MWTKIAIFCLLVTCGRAHIVPILDFEPNLRPKSASAPVIFSVSDVTVIVDQSEEFIVHQVATLPSEVTLNFEVNHEDHIELDPNRVQLNAIGNQTVTIRGIKPGGLILSGISIPKGVIRDDDLFIRISVAISRPLIYISITIGWLYFACWSVSFYPQIWLNFRRKSVVGLSFDWLAINIVGHVMYALFNSALYWNAAIQAEYYDRFPKGQIPVKLNDVVFALHASALTAFIILQCFYYESGNQRVVYKTWGLLGIAAAVFLTTLVLAATGVIAWLDFLYTCSYIKLASTLTKYTPQLYLNYQRKSTIGRSVEAVLLDFAGGVLSILQMILDAFNYDDWVSIFGDPTKFWLGLISIGFTAIFLFQHYVLYREAWQAENQRLKNLKDSAKQVNK